MSHYRVAENMGWQKVLNVAEMLNNGARVEDIARYLGCSKGRASRKINALFKAVWIPHSYSQWCAVEELIEKYPRETLLRLLATEESNWKLAKILGVSPFLVTYLRENWTILLKERPALRLYQQEAA